MNDVTKGSQTITPTDLYNLINECHMVLHEGERNLCYLFEEHFEYAETPSGFSYDFFKLQNKLHLIMDTISKADGMFSILLGESDEPFTKYECDTVVALKEGATYLASGFWQKPGLKGGLRNE